MDHAYIVTFQPYSYYTVLDAEVGQHKWFRAQACTCASYKYGFDKVRRPATIRVSTKTATYLVSLSTAVADEYWRPFY